MAHLRKKGNYYYADFYDPDRNPQRKWVPLKTKDKSVARVALVDLEKRAIFDGYDPWRDSITRTTTLNGAVGQFLSSRSHCEAKSIRNYQDVLGRFSRSVGPSVSMKSVAQSDVERFLATPGWSNATIRNYHRHLRTFFNWAVSRGLLQGSPLGGVKLKKEHKDVPAYLTRNEYSQLLESIRNTYQASSASNRSNTILWLDEVVEFACHTGLRLSELCALRWEDINLDAQHLVVSNRHRTTKNGLERRVPMVGRALEIIKEKLPSDTGGDKVVFHSGGQNQLNGEYVSKLFRRARRDAGLPDSISFHSLRHTCASWMVIAGVDLYVVKEVLGHSSIEVTQKYAHLSPSSLTAGMTLAFG